MKKNIKKIQKEDSKERILTVSARLFRTQGFAATGIDQIMKQAGLTAGAFYAHFKSKEDLFEKTLQHALAQSKLLLTKETENLTGEEKINAILKKYCSKAHRDFPEKGCVLPALAAEIYRGTKNSSVIVQDYIERWMQLIMDNLANELADEVKKEKALQMISSAVGAVLLSRILIKNSLSDRLLLSSQNLNQD